MTSITLPTWQLLAASGVTCVLFCMLLVRLLRRKRRRLQNSAPLVPGLHPQTANFDRGLFQEMLSQQIDAVFNALGAVIEAERVKLKALLLREWADSAGESRFDCIADPKPENLSDRPPQTCIQDNIGAMAAEGLSPEDIAGKTGLSRNEVDLALKMRQKPGHPTRGLEAVA